MQGSQAQPLLAFLLEPKMTEPKFKFKPHLQPALGLDGGHAARACRSDGLPELVVLHVASSKHACERTPVVHRNQSRAGAFTLHTAVILHVCSITQGWA